ncbi:MAG TPA: (4Fe-4S)-binding protein, partial [Thermoplasmatales archaeon]|nr:(4Fe-4S)-binding protein [Thermoplasmatales archaeon]
CKQCYKSCKFDAIDEDINVIKERCEGCSVCAYVCPVNAIEMIDRDSGLIYVSETRFGPMVHAILNTAEETSGKLVTEVRKNAKEIAEENNSDIILIDGPPGTGCPVISSITGTDLVLVVTEPTVSAIHDLERVIEVSKHFGVPAMVCINKFTINIENTKKIEEYCRDNDIPIIGKIPYDVSITKAMINEQSIIEFSKSSDVSREIKEMWNALLDATKR